MNILFHSNQLSERGTEVAMFDYALGNLKVLGGRSFIAAPKNRVFDKSVLDKFKSNFTVCLYNSLLELQDFIDVSQINLIYKIVHGGTKDELLHDKIPHFIHCVFSTEAKYGAFYCPISECVNKRFGTKYPVLPHIVKTFEEVEINKSIFRLKLRIPENAVVFGSYGGSKSFNIPFVKKSVVQIAKRETGIHFMFMNHEKFCDLPNVHFLPKTVDLIVKAHFIDACTAMLHARSEGETFGLAVAEFSVRNKPVITYKPKDGKCFALLSRVLRKLGLDIFYSYYYDKAHLEYCHKSITYRNKKNLLYILQHFENYYISDENYDCYSERFSEKNVMEIFCNIINNIVETKNEIQRL